MDILQKIGASFEAFAACALAMQVASERATAAAILYEDLANECVLLNLPHEHYDKIAMTFREISGVGAAMGFDDIVKTCLNTAEITR